MSPNKEIKLPIMLLEKTVQARNQLVMMKKTFGICLGLLSPIIVTGKISLHATVRRIITYDEHAYHDIQLHSSID